MRTDTISQAEAAALLNVITCSAASVSTAIVVGLVDAIEVSMIYSDGGHIENCVRPLPPKHLGIFAESSSRGRPRGRTDDGSRIPRSSLAEVASSGASAARAFTRRARRSAAAEYIALIEPVRMLRS
jgi:hypothetical protein